MNTHEYAARQIKINKMVAILVRNNFTHELVSRMEPMDWVALATEAGINLPSDKTKAAVLEMMKSLRAPLPVSADPFEKVTR